MTWDERYRGRVQLLVDVLPAVAVETRFALKGGTAINLFEHDLPRLSVDIDLTWIPVGEFANDARDMAAALEGIGACLAAPPLRLTVRPSSANGAPGINRLIVGRGASRIQIETTPVMRGTVHPVREMRVREGVEKDFGFASIQVLDFADLYAGKLAAALSRQHPRDLIDVGLLLDTRGLDERLWRTFLVYLTCSSKPAAEMLAPSEPIDLVTAFETQFRGMTSTPSSAELAARAGALTPGHRRAFGCDVKRVPGVGGTGSPKLRLAGIAAGRGTSGCTAQNAEPCEAIYCKTRRRLPAALVKRSFRHDCATQA